MVAVHFGGQWDSDRHRSNQHDSFNGEPKKKEKSFLTNKLFHGGKGAMSLRAKSVNVSTLCQLGTRSGEADKEDKRYYSSIF